MALNAVIHTNKRKIEAEKFFTGMFETALKSGELVEAVTCYKKAGGLLEEAAEHSQQSDHFRAKAAEYLSRARVLSSSEKYAAAERKGKPVKLSKKAITQAGSQINTKKN